MTIGIAAYGPDAGRAVLRALAAVEAVGRGAVRGFVSFVVLTAVGDVRRFDTQRGGGGALFPGGLAAMPAAVAQARVAGLMSSGPDRPEPLSQFTPALASVGLVTGHRMPNTVGVNGMLLNEEVLDLMRGGASPEEAIGLVIAANPSVDAGIIALSAAGAVHAADTPRVQRRGDVGRALLRSANGEAVVAVLHNSIRPLRPLASLAAEVALDEMVPDDRPDAWITFRSGAPVTSGRVNGVDVAEDGSVRAIIVDDEKFLGGRWSLGMGYEAHVLRGRRTVATMLYEPYMVVENGRLRLIDGESILAVPIRRS